MWWCVVVCGGVWWWVVVGGGGWWWVGCSSIAPLTIFLFPFFLPFFLAQLTPWPNVPGDRAAAHAAWRLTPMAALNPTPNNNPCNPNPNPSPSPSPNPSPNPNQVGPYGSTGARQRWRSPASLSSLGVIISSRGVPCSPGVVTSSHSTPNPNPNLDPNPNPNPNQGVITSSRSRARRRRYSTGGCRRGVGCCCRRRPCGPWLCRSSRRHASPRTQSGPMPTRTSRRSARRVWSVGRV